MLKELGEVSQYIHVYDSDENKCGMEVACGIKVKNINHVMEEKVFILASKDIENMIEKIKSRNVQEIILVHEIQGEIFFEGEVEPALTYNNYFMN